jgi:hypothetical protein
MKRAMIGIMRAMLIVSDMAKTVDPRVRPDRPLFSSFVNIDNNFLNFISIFPDLY